MSQLRLLTISIFWLACTGFAQSNPVPFITQPLVPASVSPGGAGFSLTVNGVGFTPAAVVNWNGTPRPTTLINSSQLSANISAADISKAGTAAISVFNAAPGDVSSNILYLYIANPISSIGLRIGVLSFGGNPPYVAAGDFNRDGNVDVVKANPGLTIFLGNGDGSFQAPIIYSDGTGPVAIGDFNADGIIDLAVESISGGTILYPGIKVLLGNGDGTFQGGMFIPTNTGEASLSTADFNADGVLDLMLGVGSPPTSLNRVFLGNGDGTFSIGPTFDGGYDLVALAIDDFNKDGKLDIAANPRDHAASAIYRMPSVLLGNGDGTFGNRLPVLPANYSNHGGVASGDLNNDGNPDLAFVATGISSTQSLWVMLGNGDGTFQSPVNYQVTNAAAVAIADMNGDGKLDLVVAAGSNIVILFGNGDGTFSTPRPVKVPVHSMGYGGIAIADFNNDGRPDVLVSSFNSIVVLLQCSTVSVVPSKLSFSTQTVGTISNAKNVVLKNTGGLNVNVASITISGTNSTDFAQSNNCPTTLVPGSNCTVSVTFSPTATGTRTAILNFQDDAEASPQTVKVIGTGG